MRMYEFLLRQVSLASLNRLDASGSVLICQTLQAVAFTSTSRRLNVPFKRRHSSCLSFCGEVGLKVQYFLQRTAVVYPIARRKRIFYGRFSIVSFRILADLCSSLNRRTLREVELIRRFIPKGRFEVEADINDIENIDGPIVGQGCEMA